MVRRPCGSTARPLEPGWILAVSLFHSMLTPERAKSVLEVAERELLTPYGLLTLSPKDPKYAGNYGGNAFQRDSVYHQGTVWPWLLGPYISAVVKLRGRSPR